MDKINESEIKRNFLQMTAVTQHSTIHSTPLHFMETSGQLHLLATVRIRKLPTAGLDVLEKGYLNKQAFHTNELKYQKLNATLMNSTESITATTVPVITQVFSSIKLMFYMLT
jgi:hypothetical protein